MAKELITLSNLSPKPGSHKKKVRVGRGPSSGKGKTAGRGQKGAKSRSGYSLQAGFEGGQNPLHKRLPKRGFTNIFRKEYVILNVSYFADFAAGTEISYDSLVTDRKIRSKAKNGLKILGNGDISVALKFNVNAITASARQKIEAAGGSVVIVEANGSKVADDTEEKSAE